MRSRIAARFAALFAIVAVLLAMAAMPATAAPSSNLGTPP